MENPVFAKAAFRERLRVVFERVWWWLCTGIAHRQTQILLHQNEIHMRAAALNRARLHITRHAKPLGVSTVTKPPQLFDRDVIALALLHPGVGKIAQHHQDQNRSAAEFQILTALARHKDFPEACTQLYAQPVSGYRPNRAKTRLPIPRKQQK